MPHALAAGVGGAAAAPRRAAGLFALAAHRGPLPAWPRLQVERAEFIHADHHLGVARARATFRSATAYRCSMRDFLAW